MHPVFEVLSVKTLKSQDLDQFYNVNGKKILFLWGNNCPNCEIAKNSLLDNLDLVKSLGFVWYHNNVYDDFDLSTKFGLHGIPVFIIYKDQKNIGRITSFPGIDKFVEILEKI